MKKILSLCLALLLLVSAVPMAYAADTTAASNGTTITATGTKSEAYTVTVPATMNPGQTGNVTASGSWPANKTLKVTCPSSVDLYNGDDKMSVGVTFAGLELSGDNVDPIAATNAAITIATVDTSTFFGTWTGTLTYTVELADNTEYVTCTLVSENGNYETTTITVEAGTTWGEYCESLTEDNNPLGLWVNTMGYVSVDYNMAILITESGISTYVEAEPYLILPSEVIENRTYYIV